MIMHNSNAIRINSVFFKYMWVNLSDAFWCVLCNFNDPLEVSVVLNDISRILLRTGSYPTIFLHYPPINTDFLCKDWLLF